MESEEEKRSPFQSNCEIGSQMALSYFSFNIFSVWAYVESTVERSNNRPTFTCFSIDFYYRSRTDNWILSSFFLFVRSSRDVSIRSCWSGDVL